MFNFLENLKLKNSRQAAKIVSEILLKLEELSQPEVKLMDLEEVAFSLIKEFGAESFNKGYLPHWAKVPYPSIICASINEEAVHCPPKDKVLKDGDIVKYDIGIKYKGRCGDAALTVLIGNVSQEKKELVNRTKDVLEEVTKLVRANLPVKELSIFIENYMKRYGYKAVRDYTGHAIGETMHEEPLISNLYDGRDYGCLKAGQVICLEPIFTTGKGKTVIKNDGWSAVTTDRKPVAQFENMILVLNNGYEVLTHHLKIS